MKKVTRPQVASADEVPEGALPPEITEALGDIAQAAQEGLLALSVGVGLGVVHQLMEAEVDEIVGQKGKHDSDRKAKRHGHEQGSMTLGGRRVKVERPRVRSAGDERELGLRTYEHFADRDPLTEAVMNRMLAGVSTRRFAGVGEPVGEGVEKDSSATSKSSVSEAFIERTTTALGELMGRELADMRLAAMMLDGLQIAERTHVVALGITTEGVKVPLGLWEGSTENATLARSLLADLVDRGLDPEQAILFVIDGSKALRKAIGDVFGEPLTAFGHNQDSGLPRIGRASFDLAPHRPTVLRELILTGNYPASLGFDDHMRMVSLDLDVGVPGLWNVVLEADLGQLTKLADTKVFVDVCEEVKREGARLGQAPSDRKGDVVLLVPQEVKDRADIMSVKFQRDHERDRTGPNVRNVGWDRLLR